MHSSLGTNFDYDRALLAGNSSANHRIIRVALLPEFGGMDIDAMDLIRLLIRKLTFDRIRLLLAAFVQER
jgi:hypothetical protein